MPLEAYSPGTLTVTIGADPVTTLVLELGTPGPAGAPGPAGQNGVGVPSGGTVGQVLAKIDGTNYNTEWADVQQIDPAQGFTLNSGATINAQNGLIQIGESWIFGQMAFGSGSSILMAGGGITFANGTQTTAWIDAPSDGYKYARNNAGWEQINNGVWGQITGALINQTDLQNALNAKYDASNPSGYITTSALAPYLLSSTAASTYLTQSNAASTYLTISNASSTYLTQASASSTYLTQANASSTYLTQSNASSTYLTQANAASTYFPKPTGTTAQYIDGTGALQTFPTVTTAGKMVTSVRNNTGATLTKGTVVYINGAVGNIPTVAKAQANAEPTSKATFGFVETDITNNSNGNIIVIGLLENLDTQGFADGTLIYLSPTVAGGWTSTQPFSPYHYVGLGTVIRGNHPTQGSIQVRIQNGFQLDEMSDVGATAPTNNNVLTWNAGTSQWLDKSISTILGYTPADDALVLKKANNLSDLANAGTARTNLGLGTMAVATATDYLDKAGNLSGLASVSTARTNLGLGTMATATATDYLDKAGNLSGLASVSTARTNLGVAYATDAQTVAGASTTTVVSPASLRLTKYVNQCSEVDLGAYSWLSTFTGTGWTGTRNRLNFPIISGTTSAGSGIWGIENQFSAVGTNVGGMDWSKRVVLAGRFIINQTTVSSNNIFRYTIGKGSSAVGNLSVAGIGVRCVFGSPLEIQVHNGTTLTNVTTSFTPTIAAPGTVFEVRLESDGTGNVVCFVNGNNVGSTSAGPTSLFGSTRYWTVFELESASTNSSAVTVQGGLFRVNYGY